MRKICILQRFFYYEKFDEPPEKRYIDDFLTNFSSQKFSYFKTLKTFFTNRTMLAVSLAALANVVFFMSTQTTNALVFQIAGYRSL